MHTPGPWQTQDVGHGHCIDPNIAWVGLTSKQAPEETAANARLIAAAPELLAALQMIETDKDGDGFICKEAMDMVRHAIAKAEGRKTCNSQ